MAARRPISLQISVVFPVFHRVAAQRLGSAYIDMFIGNVHIRIRADDKMCIRDSPKRPQTVNLVRKCPKTSMRKSNLSLIHI